MATAAKHIVPDFAELARTKRRADVQAILDQMSLREILSLTADLIDNPPHATDDYIDAILPVENKLNDAWKLLEEAVELAEHPLARPRSDWRLSSMAHDLGMGE